MALLGLILLFVLFGARLFVIVGGATAAAFYLYTDDHQTMESLGRIVTKIEGLTGKNVFLSIPLFVAAGVVMTQGGIAKRLIEVARAAVGWLPGGLAIATVLACVVFAAISGSSPVTLIAVGVIMFPALTASKYPENFSLGLITTAGSLGCLVPPSIAMLIYAISVSGRAAVDPADLFLAGLVPAVLIAGLLSLYAMWVGRKIPESREPFVFARLVKSVKEGGFALMLPVIILGGIYSGTFTPTQAGAVALAYAVFVTVFVHRDLDVRRLPDLFSEASVLVGSLILIVTLSFGLNDFLAEVEAPDKIVEWIRKADLSPFAFFLLVNAVLIILGALMDSISATLIFAPILAPIALDVYGIDPLHFGVVFVVNMEIGYLAPPVATNLFVASAVFQRPFGQVTRAVLPTLGIVCGALILCMYVPTISKAAVNWKRNVAIYQPFPWEKPVREESDGDVVSGGAPAVNVPVTGPTGQKVMSVEEMQRMAEEDPGTGIEADKPEADDLLEAPEGVEADKPSADDLLEEPTGVEADKPSKEDLLEEPTGVEADKPGPEDLLDAPTP